MGKRYGYGNRPDREEPLIMGGGSVGDVQTPRGEFPYGVARAVKEVAAESRHVLLVVSPNGGSPNAYKTLYGLAATYDFVGASSSFTESEEANGFLAGPNRHGFVRRITASGASGSGFHRIFERAIWTPSLKPWLDPDEPPLHATLRIEDVVGGLAVATETDANYAIGFGLTDEPTLAGLTGATWPWYAWLGFQATFAHPNTSGVWRCYFIDEAGTEHVAFTTSKDCGVAHHLVIELNGVDKTIVWKIDDEQVASHNVAAGEPWPDTASGETELVWGTMLWSGGGTLASADLKSVRMCDCMPVISIILEDVAA